MAIAGLRHTGRARPWGQGRPGCRGPGGSGCRWRLRAAGACSCSGCGAGAGSAAGAPEGLRVAATVEAARGAAWTAVGPGASGRWRVEMCFCLLGCRGLRLVGGITPRTLLSAGGRGGVKYFLATPGALRPRRAAVATVALTAPAPSCRLALPLPSCCLGGEIGRRKGLKIPRSLPPCGFEPRPRHHAAPRLAEQPPGRLEGARHPLHIRLAQPLMHRQGQDAPLEGLRLRELGPGHRRVELVPPRHGLHPPAGQAAGKEGRGPPQPHRQAQRAGPLGQLRGQQAAGAPPPRSSPRRVAKLRRRAALTSARSVAARMRRARPDMVQPAASGWKAAARGSIGGRPPAAQAPSRRQGPLQQVARSRGQTRPCRGGCGGAACARWWTAGEGGAGRSPGGLAPGGRQPGSTTAPSGRGRDLIRLKTLSVPQEPSGRPRCSPSRAWAQSSMRLTPWAAHSSLTSETGWGRPK